MENKKLFKLGEYLKEIRRRNGLTQEQFAYKLNIPRSTYANYENNKRNPSMELFTALKNTFNIDLFSIINSERSVKITEDGEITISQNDPYLKLKETYSAFLDAWLKITALEGKPISSVTPIDVELSLKVVCSAQYTFLSCLNDICPLETRLSASYDDSNIDSTTSD